MQSNNEFDRSDPTKVLRNLGIPLDHFKYVRLVWPLCNRIRGHIKNRSLQKAVKRLENYVTLSDDEMLMEVRNVCNAVGSLLWQVDDSESQAVHVLLYVSCYGFADFGNLLWFFTQSLESIEGIDCHRGRAIAAELVTTQIDILRQNNT